MKETSRISAEELEAIRRAQQPRRGIGLLVYHRDGVRFVPLDGDRPLLVGREPPRGPGAIAIDDPSLSREHARFTLLGDTVKVVDLGSKNGTWFRGERVQHAEIAPGDEIRLSGVPVVVQGDLMLHPGLRPLSHERFRVALEDEVVRSGHFRRPFALVLLRAEGRAHVSTFHEHVSAKLRSVDRSAFYSPDTVELLLPEAGVKEAIKLAKELVTAARGRKLSLMAGVAVYPDAAPEAEALIEACRKSLESASAAERVGCAAVRARLSERRGRSAGTDERPIVASPALRDVFDKLPLLARSSLPILILGETGVGKEVLAQRIHAQSDRHGKPLVIVNCAAITETLVEATLFGHEQGAFTGATRQQKGLFEAADGGTLMLDEVGDLSKPSQAALLRVLETSRVRRVGASDEIDVDVRILAATHRDLEAMSDRGEFRKDLFHRLGGDSVTIPPLRERRDEIEPLSLAFLRRANEVNDRSVTGIDPRALALLQSYEWPGNVRELRNAVERAVVLTQSDTVTCEDLPERVRNAAAPEKPPEPPQPPVAAPSSDPTPIPVPRPASRQGGAATSYDLRAHVKQYEAQLIVQALNEHGGKQRETAQHLHLPLRTLVHKMKMLDITRAPYASPAGPRGRKRT